MSYGIRILLGLLIFSILSVIINLAFTGDTKLYSILIGLAVFISVITVNVAANYKKIIKSKVEYFVELTGAFLEQA